jgi:hypothetical protein
LNISSIGRSAVFFGRQTKIDKQESNTTQKLSGIIASEQFRGAINLTLSDNAKKLFMQKQEELIAQMKFRSTGHIKCDDPFIIIEAKDSDLDKMKTRYNLDSESLEAWREDWKDVASRWGFQASDLMLDFYGELQKTLGASHEFRTDFNNMGSLSNKFAELRQSLIDQHSEGEICCEELEIKLNELDEAFKFATEVLSMRAEHREAVSRQVRKDQIDNLQSMRRLNNISGAMKAQLACGATIIFLGDDDEDGLNTDRIFYGESHMPLDYLEAIGDSIRYLTELTKDFVLKNGAVRTEEDNERLDDFLRNAPPIENGFTFDELLEKDELRMES